VDDVTNLSNARIQLKIGTLYGVLDRLVGDGLIEPEQYPVPWTDSWSVWSCCCG
jgi:PadR family transcriptional regulator PadR